MSIEGDRNFGGVFRPGEVLTAVKMNELAAAAGYGKQWHSNGSQTVQGTFGTANLSSQETPLPNTYDYPFKVSVTNGNGNEKIVRIRAGTVNNFVPKIDGKYLDADPAPGLKFSTAANGKKIVALKVTKDGAKFFPKTIEVVLLDSEESLEPSDSVGYIQIASITCSTTGGDLRVTSINQFIYASQIVARAKPGTETAIWAFSSR